VSLIYAGILLLSSAILLFEITLTRVFSVAQWYHFAFMVVSLALLGFGASGSLLCLFPGVARRRLAPLLASLSLGFVVSCLGGYILINLIPFDSFRVGWESRQLLYLIAYYVSLAIPFLFGGLALGAALSQMPGLAGKLYGFNLIGSGLGCLLVLIGPPLFGGAGTVILACLLGMAAAFVFWLGYSKTLSALALILAAGLVSLLLYLPAGLEIKMSPYKDLRQVLRQPAAKTLWTRWNAFSRVDVVADSALHVAPGLSFAYREALPPQIGIAVDGENLSPVSQISAQEASFTEYLPSALAYYLSPAPTTLIIEPQGGLDVLTALHHHSPSVVAVVSNPLVVKAVERYGEEGREVFADPRVRVAVEGARSYLSRSPELFDVVQLSLTDSFKVVAAGSYSLSENFLYTVEAFKQYYQHLAPDGFLSVTRWIQVPPSQETRLVSVAVAALEELGVEAGAHIMAIRSFQTITLLVKQSPVSPEDIAVVKDFCRQRQFDMVYFPGIAPGDLNRYNVLPEEVYYQAFVNLLSPAERADFLQGYPYDVSATSDDRPFFFHFFKWDQAPEVLRNLGKTWQPFGGLGFLIVVALLAIAIITSAVFILLPLAFGLKPGPGGAGRQVRWRVFAYFAALGIGFLFIEIPLMQRFIGFLDQPTYSFAIVLFTILVCSGLGSLVSGRLAGALPQAILALAIVAALYPLLISALVEALLGLALPFRLLLAIAVLAPLSFLMGIPFPSGVRIVGNRAPELVAWAWGINGCASVISSVLAMMIALSWGFSWVLVGAGSAYGLGLAAIYTWARQP